MRPAPTLSLLPAHVDVIDWAAQQLIAANRAQLPDLSHVVVLLPVASSMARLRRRLTHHAGGPLLGPDITTITGFAARGRKASGLSTLDGELILADALRQHPAIFPGIDRWTLAESLLSLFEELCANTSMLADDEARFVAQVAQGYRSGMHAPASDEAPMVHTLWRAYLQATAQRSPAALHGPALRDALIALPAQAQIWLIGFDALRGDELGALSTVMSQRALHVVLHGPLHGRGREALASLSMRLGIAPNIVDGSDDAYAVAFDDSGASLYQRREKNAAPSGIRLARAAHPEHEARVVDLAVRQALLDGAKDVAVVTQDRRLARRLRALLERACVPLRDEAGWALSTSAAAASLGHWLDCWQHNCNFRALLDLFKSDFYTSIDDAAIATLETLIYRHAFVGGLEQLRKLDGAPAAPLAALSAAIRSLPSWQGPARSGAQWAQALLQSLQTSPLWQAWQEDAAGAALRTQLEELHAALRRQNVQIDAERFRRLLESRIESASFVPQSTPSPVRLLTLEQAQGLRCEMLIIAGASSAQLPGRPTPQGLFNHAVRAELGLPNWQEQWRRQLGRFRAMLHAAPQVLISYAPERDGEDAEPCPWVQALYDSGHAQLDQQLPALALDGRCEIVCEDAPLPVPTLRPQPTTTPALLPETLSATAHQALIDCPYKFFAGRMLRLNGWQEPDEPPDRSDYGERVHRILEAFQQQIAGLPPPFAGSVCAERRDEAMQTLDVLARAVFASDLRSRALSRLWLSEFIARIPYLVDWMIERAPRWPQVISEDQRERELVPGLRLKGRLDRLEQDAHGNYCVVDYKTGHAPKAAEVERGEIVQATHYALLASPCSRVEYLRLGNEGEKPEVVEAQALQQAAAATQLRLEQLFASLRNTALLPAHGDELTCSRCDYRGVCREGDWYE